MPKVDREHQKRIRQAFKKSMDTILEREAAYGSGAGPIAGALAAMFPEGVTLKTKNDHERFFYVVMMVMKMTRFCRSFEDEGAENDDSVHDAGNYGKLLEIALMRMREEMGDDPI